MNRSMTVSVCMITYGHEKYIKEAIRGVLMQQADFAIELIIANDCSPDRTDEMVKEVLAHHPNRHWVRYTRHEQNKGMLPNFIWALEQCSGKYIAYCEGDDYWIDSGKLQKQINVLEANSDIALSFHQALKIDIENSLFEVYPVVRETNFDAALFFAIPTIPMASIVFRNGYNLKFLDSHSHPDFLLLCGLLSYGKAHLTKEVMSVYRVHPNGVSSSQNSIDYIRRRTNELFSETKSESFSAEVRKQVARIYMEYVTLMLNRYSKEISKAESVCHLLRFLKLKRSVLRDSSYYYRLVQHLVTSR